MPQSSDTLYVASLWQLGEPFLTYKEFWSQLGDVDAGIYIEQLIISRL
jgi:hypothetical protein